ncbi:hypothetical protein C8R45DRAFT_979285 [Mycena sanguinolenta]|nr:hypothetical protein C8R45DRAFT_979285 [Mycena sanguinolenta]
MKAGGKGKQPKRFLDQSAALSLASSIAGIQEKKSQTRAERNQLAQVGQSRPERPSRLSKSKAKLKETKALIAAQRSESKKARNKRRKGLNESSVPPRKSVSFA